MKVYFATNRNKTTATTGWFGDGFQKSTVFFRIGSAEIAPGPPKRDGTVTSVSVSRETTGTDPLTNRMSFQTIGSPGVYKQLVTELKHGGRGCLVFLPGFAYSFADSLTRAANLARLYSQDGQDLIPFCFSWPSNGELTPSDYRADQADAEASGRAMARAYRALLALVARLREEDRCNAPIHLLCHSMGNRALRFALQGIPETGGRHVRLFDSAILAAPDEDCDALGRNDKLKPIGRLARRVDVYFNPKDKPTTIADDIGVGDDRLGTYGPSDMAALSDFECPITVMNCRRVDVPFEDLTRHQYYRLSDLVIEDIRDVMADADRREARHRAGRFNPETGHFDLAHDPLPSQPTTRESGN